MNECIVVQFFWLTVYKASFLSEAVGLTVSENDANVP